MTDNELKKLSRADLLELLIQQSEQVQALQKKLDEAEKKLRSREIDINEAGSIAEAAMQINGVFEAAQAAGQQYLDNIKLLNQRQEQVSAQLEQESRERAERLVAEAARERASIETETKIKCAEMVEKARAESKAYWDEVYVKLEAFYRDHQGLKELLFSGMPKQ